eukprot:jgi/Tetstr1/433757/TSEL_022975.t1
MLARLGLSRHPDKGQWEPPSASSAVLSETNHGFLCGSSRSVHGELDHFMFLTVKPAQFDLRELHDVLRTKDSCSERVNTMAHKLRRDLDCWKVAVTNHENGRSIYKPLETAYMHVDSSVRLRGVRGTVLNETTEARGFWHDGDRDELHITYNELKAVQ